MKEYEVWFRVKIVDTETLKAKNEEDAKNKITKLLQERFNRNIRIEFTDILEIPA